MIPWGPVPMLAVFVVAVAVSGTNTKPDIAIAIPMKSLQAVDTMFMNVIMTDGHTCMQPGSMAMWLLALTIGRTVLVAKPWIC